MPADPTAQALSATRRWLKPVVYVLLRCGVTWHEFCALAKAAYVEVATARFGKRGRPTNVSRTAMLTGLTRRDVRLLRNRAESAEPPAPMHTSKASQILSLWHLDPEFSDREGRPLPLPLEGDRASFAQLLRKSGAGDVRPITVLRELLDARAVRKLEDGRVEALARNYIPKPTDEQLIRLWGTVLADVADVYVHNMTRSPRSPTRFERAAKNTRMPLSAAPAFREFLEREGQAFLERTDAWLAENAVKEDKGDPKEPTTRLGVGVYHIDDRGGT
jgi:hypothetical protein